MGTKMKVSLWNLKFHPIEKEHHLPNHHFFVFHVNFPRVYIYNICVYNSYTYKEFEGDQTMFIYIHIYI